ncbi:MAG: VOC family protein [Clostridiales bacterium]|nr:VOC family protein [Clostridiales bacterium]
MKQFVKGFHHFGLPTADMEATIAFYRKLGAEIVFETVVTEAGQPCRVVHLQVSNLYVEAYERDPVAGVTGAIDHLAVSTDDIEGAFSEAKRLGLPFVKEEIGVSDYWPGTARWFHLVGPSGEHIEFAQG